jgi:hypothetical protein
MMNQRGDRYVCSDPNCGCVIEVKEPSAATRRPTETRQRSTPVAGGYADATDNLSDRGHGVPAAGNVSERGFRSESISTAGDFGKQGVSGEGIFGTVGGESDHIHTEGRYGSRLPRKSTEAAPSNSTWEPDAETAELEIAGENTIRCFCGGVMRPVGATERVRGVSA